jgi:hypothetical protein
MQREKLINVSLMFRILEVVVNYGDFVCVNCYLYIGIVEILNLQLRCRFG